MLATEVNVLKQKIRKARNLAVKAQAAKDEVIELVTELYGSDVLEAPADSAINADRICDMITCFLSYGENTVDEIIEEIKKRRRITVTTNKLAEKLRKKALEQNSVATLIENIEHNINNCSLSGTEMLKRQAVLAEQYKYKPLPPLFSMQQRQEYLDNLPEEYKSYHGQPLYSKSGLMICRNLTDRTFVCGDYGIFLEADEENMCLENIKVKEGQEYRINDERYSSNVKYIWYTPKTGSEVKIYFQQKTVDYADYKVGKYYFSPYEVILK